MAIDLKSATPDTTLPATGFLFGADSQAATDPSIYSMQALRDAVMGSSAGVNGASVTTSAPLLNHAQTWNAAGVTFAGWKLNVTDTASATASVLLDLQIGGASKFSVKKDGTVIVPDGASNGPAIGRNSTGLYFSGNTIHFVFASNNELSFLYGTGLLAAANQAIGWSSNKPNNSSADVVFSRVAAGVVKLSNNSTGAGVLVTQAVVVASLPAAATAGVGARAFVTDATANTFASVVAGGGSTKVPVYSDGTNWLIG